MDFSEIQQKIYSIDWSKYGTAYGNASGIEPVRNFSLKEKIKSLFVFNEYSAYKIRQRGHKVDVAKCLTDLFSENTQTQIEATRELDNALCHQHIMICGAAGPAYEFIILRFKQLQPDEEAMTEELFDILRGFTVCTAKVNLSEPDSEWVKELRSKLKRDVNLFEKYSSHHNEIVSEFSREICEILRDDNIDPEKIDNLVG